MGAGAAGGGGFLYHLAGCRGAARARPDRPDRVPALTAQGPKTWSR